MAKIEDLIAQVSNERLRLAIAGEVKALKKTKKFGLVFEEHLPETVRLPLLPVRVGELVALRQKTGNQLWRVKRIRKGFAICEKPVEDSPLTDEIDSEFPVGDLVVVRSFGDAIYPALVPVDRVSRGGPDKPWHLLVNAENFHALQLLLYAYENKVDVIYIDPPYNTGARDWKYNNDYVDKADSWRHSKWLSMIKKRLLLAKRLLKSSLFRQDSWNSRLRPTRCKKRGNMSAYFTVALCLREIANEPCSVSAQGEILDGGSPGRPIQLDSCKRPGKPANPGKPC